MTIRVELQVAEDAAAPPDTDQFCRWASAAITGRTENTELTIRIVSEAESAALNERFRNRKYATNVLAFPATLPDEIDLAVLGDLAICGEVVQREAGEQGKPVEAHWAHMVVHGTLHLVGYDHETQMQANEMESLEVQILRGLGYPDPYLPVGETGEHASVTGTGAE
ncbi:MAG: rRNA maturation RNase YbeY [Gammaproteobacteria bacterium]